MAGAPLGDKLRGKALATYVIARAKDGYVVVYSLAEVDPAMSGSQMMVADTARTESRWTSKKGHSG